MACANWAEVMGAAGAAGAAAARAGLRTGLPCFGFLAGREVTDPGLLDFFGSHESKEADGEGAFVERTAVVGFLSHSLRDADADAEAEAEIEAEAEVAAADVEAAFRSNVEPFRFVCFGMFAGLLMFTIRFAFKWIITI
jgi:hypothetical protein